MTAEEVLKKCDSHGFFRGEACPYCDDEGKFLMNENELERLARIIAGILRHFPAKFGVRIDNEGWVTVNDLVHGIQRRRHQFHWLRPHHIMALAETDPKGRYQVENGKIRATYGHTIEVNLDLPTKHIPKRLFYPTTEEEVDLLFEGEIRPTDRAFVHLSETYEQAMEAGGQRTNDPIIIEIDAEGAIADGIEIMKAGKRVYVARRVPSQFMSLVKRMGSEDEEADGLVEEGEGSAEDAPEVDVPAVEEEGNDEPAPEPASEEAEEEKE